MHGSVSPVKEVFFKQYLIYVFIQTFWIILERHAGHCEQYPCLKPLQLIIFVEGLLYYGMVIYHAPKELS